MISKATLSTRREPLRVLLVEDGLVNQKLAISLLTRYGHSVTVAGNGQEAVQLLEAEHYDLVLMDVNMPIMDGLSATTAIRAREKELSGGPRIPIVGVTSSTDRDQCLAAGMDDYIAKPLNAQVLQETLQRIIA